MKDLVLIPGHVQELWVKTDLVTIKKTGLGLGLHHKENLSSKDNKYKFYKCQKIITCWFAIMPTRLK